MREPPIATSCSFPSFASPATPADLFGQSVLLDAARRGLEQIVRATEDQERLVVVGLPLEAGPYLYNCAAVVGKGAVLGVVPKQHLPNYKEFYERRWFRPATGAEPAEIDLFGSRVPFGIDLLFEGQGEAGRNVVIGVEICEDLWMPIPPSSSQGSRGRRSY